MCVCRVKWHACSGTVTSKRGRRAARPLRSKGGVSHCFVSLWFMKFLMWGFIRKDASATVCTLLWPGCDFGFEWWSKSPKWNLSQDLVYEFFLLLLFFLQKLASGQGRLSNRERNLTWLIVKNSKEAFLMKSFYQFQFFIATVFVFLKGKCFYHIQGKYIFLTISREAATCFKKASELFVVMFICDDHTSWY